VFENLEALELPAGYALRAGVRSRHGRKASAASHRGAGSRVRHPRVLVLEFGSFRSMLIVAA